VFEFWRLVVCSYYLILSFRFAAESYASVWDVLADTPEEVANLRARAELMQQIAAIVSENGWTQVEAAKHCGVTQPRINDL
jgi:predicted XRE-type DNA-binding protein